MVVCEKGIAATREMPMYFAPFVPNSDFGTEPSITNFRSDDFGNGE